eukprot:403341190
MDSDVKKHTKIKIKKIQDIKDSIKDNKVLQSVFKSISRDRRQELTDPKKVIPTLNEFGNPPKFWTKKDCKLHISTLDRGSLEEKKRLLQVQELDMNRFMRQNSLIGINQSSGSLLQQPLTQRNNYSKDNLLNGSGSSRLEGYMTNNVDIDDTLREDLNLFNKTQIHLQQHNSNSSVNQTRVMEKSVSLPQLNNSQNRNGSLTDRSQLEPYLMNMKFSRQISRKPLLATTNVNEKRFETFNLFPENLSQNKKFIWNLKFDRQKERDTSDWAEGNGKLQNGQIYEQVDLDKFKFKKSFIATIKSESKQGSNNNHQRFKSRYY